MTLALNNPRWFFFYVIKQRDQTKPNKTKSSPVGWGSIISRLHFCRWVRTASPGLANALNMILNHLKSLSFSKDRVSPLWPGPIKLGDVVPVKVQSIGQIELINHFLYLKPFNCVKTYDRYWNELLVLHSNIWNCLNACKRMNYVE